MCVHIINGLANAVIAGQSICVLISSQKTFLERHVDGTKVCVFLRPTKRCFVDHLSTGVAI